MPMHKVEVDDEIECLGRMRRVTKLLNLTVTLDGVEDAICLPMDATRVEVSKDAGTEAVKK